MPASIARAAAIYRSQLTGEHPYTARAGLKRDGSPGLDHCTDAQAQLRALLALGWFNTGLLAAPDLGWTCQGARSVERCHGWMSGTCRTLDEFARGERNPGGQAPGTRDASAKMAGASCLGASSKIRSGCGSRGAARSPRLGWTKSLAVGLSSQLERG